MPFVDGEPIDAAKLGALETKLNQLESKIPTFGGSNTNISIDGSTTTISTGPEVEAGEVSGVSVSTSKKTHEYTFKKTFTKKPIVVISMRGGESSHVMSVRVLSNSVSENGFKYVVSALESAYTAKTTPQIGINYIAITY